MLSMLLTIVEFAVLIVFTLLMIPRWSEATYKGGWVYMHRRHAQQWVIVGALNVCLCVIGVLQCVVGPFSWFILAVSGLNAVLVWWSWVQWRHQWAEMRRHEDRLAAEVDVPDFPPEF
jgi:hypothetical protein